MNRRSPNRSSPSKRKPLGSPLPSTKKSARNSRNVIEMGTADLDENVPLRVISGANLIKQGSRQKADLRQRKFIKEKYSDSDSEVNTVEVYVANEPETVLVELRNKKLTGDVSKQYCDRLIDVMAKEYVRRCATFYLSAQMILPNISVELINECAVLQSSWMNGIHGKIYKFMKKLILNFISKLEKFLAFLLLFVLIFSVIYVIAHIIYKNMSHCCPGKYWA